MHLICSMALLHVSDSSKGFAKIVEFDLQLHAVSSSETRHRSLPFSENCFTFGNCPLVYASAQ